MTVEKEECIIMATKTANLYVRIDSDMNIAEIEESELNAELEKGYADMVKGRTKSARQTFADLRKDYEI